MAEIAQLRDEYKELYGKKPHHSWSEEQLEKLIKDAKDQDSKTEGGEKPESQDQKVHKEAKLPEVEPPVLEKIGGDNTFNGLPVFEGGNGLRSGRHLVYKGGVPIYWRNSVIETYLRRNGSNSLEFPPNTRFIQENIKFCKDCG